MKFNAFFKTATGNDPHPYQARFAVAETMPHLVCAPTGAGKTATAVLGWLWRLQSMPDRTPRRLVYCLPMRVLVEQSAQAAQGWLEKLGRGPNADATKRIDVHVLMGGAETEDWSLSPERPAVLIGTQDMLISRALNRGYGAGRFHWPIDFGLLNNDCLWVFDEPQLMGAGVATSAQLAGLRTALGVCGVCPSVWMSATLEPDWLDVVDFRGKFNTPPLTLGADQHGDDYNEQGNLFKRMTAEKTLAPLGVKLSKDLDDKEAKSVAQAILNQHVSGTQTLAVLNTVKRARAVYKALALLRKSSDKLLLVHSRFRPHEREGTPSAPGLNDLLQLKDEAIADRIIVATQVVEAGVDVSSRTLIVELAPWASLVQRMGRCNRTGDDGPGQVFWIDLDEAKLASPYSPEELKTARKWLQKLEGESVSPRSLNDFADHEPVKLPFEHKHVLRKRDLLGLFDTSPDLAGNDVDVSRFVRSDEESLDVQAFWRPEPPPKTSLSAADRRRLAPSRAELVRVPIGSFKSEFLTGERGVYRWDSLDEVWKRLTVRDAGSVLPGQVFWIPTSEGGYDVSLGWEPSVKRWGDAWTRPIQEATSAANQPPREESFDDDTMSECSWRTIAEHTDEVALELKAIIDTSHMPLSPEDRAALKAAVRWHDWGKAHPVFQSGVNRDEAEPEWAACRAVAKAPRWVRYRRDMLPADEADPNDVNDDYDDSSAGVVGGDGEVLLENNGNDRVEAASEIDAVDDANAAGTAALTEGKPQGQIVSRFRHEAASALGLLALFRQGAPPNDWRALSPESRRLVLFLIAAHHGKVRVALRSMPNEKPTPKGSGADSPHAAGVWERDELPSVDLGDGVTTPSATLSLKPMLLGDEQSWSAGVLALRDHTQYGPFRLAYLEAIIRAADCRASALASAQGDTARD